MGWMPVSPWKIGKSQDVAIGASSTVSTNAFGSATKAVAISVTSACRIDIGPSPVATATSTLLNAGVGPVLFGCGEGDKIAVIQESASGKLNVTELSH